VSDYQRDYFDSRVDPRRQAMQREEYARLLEKTGLTGGTVLDVGCGLGELLDLFDDAAWTKKYGIEVAEHAIGVCSAKGIDFELPAGEGWCDLIVARGSLQHLDRPVDLLWRAHSWLRPGGWFVALATPNAGGPVYRLFQDLPALDPPRNFVVFSDRVLEQTLLNVGFDHVEFEYPYRGTPYASPVRDHLRFAGRLVGVRRPFAFWRNMMECFARK
jgi:SAM-dependent methyltransferase